ncbi:MAG: hypothetical protein JST04_05670 [Bdellovibrionales bacterium]|nr:hypothetical protein [Bdellovibrionales bacterium]
MKKLAALLLPLVSLSAQASDYQCRIVVNDANGQTLGAMALDQDVGMSAGRLYTVAVSKKKNIFGKTVQTVELTLDGLVQNGGESGESSIDANLSLVTTTEKKSKIEQSKLGLAKIEGKWNVQIDQVAANGYAIKGSCTMLGLE